MERQKSMHQPGALTLDDAISDPAFNPVLLPDRTRADIVQDRPAGGSPDEVADANPGLAAAVPATVGQAGPAGAGSHADVLPTQGESDESKGGADADPGAATKGALGVPVEDGSGMEVPELAVLP